jgi:hypothetical protein
MNASPNPFEYEDDYVSVWFVASWDTSVFCGVDGGCQDVWCDADYVDVNINDGEFTYESARDRERANYVTQATETC